jgi:hypothetical protein
MRAPVHERMALLDVAIARATDELNAPIDRIEVTGTLVNCWAGPRKVTLSYHYAQGGQMNPVGRFTPTVGSGSWRVVVVDDPARVGRRASGRRSPSS